MNTSTIKLKSKGHKSQGATNGLLDFDWTAFLDVHMHQPGFGTEPDLTFDVM